MSIKNKLVTAITTAGLLAGLFGSAFVPAARAAAETLSTDSGLTCLSTDTDVEAVGSEDGATTAAACYAAVGSNVSVTVSLEDAAGALTVAANDTIAGLSVSTTGTTIVSAPAAAVGGFAGWSLAANAKSANLNVITATAANTVITFNMVVAAPTAANGQVSVNLSQGATSLGTLTIIGTASGTAGIPAAADSLFVPTLYDADQDVNANTISGTQAAIANPALEACGGVTLAVSGIPCYAAGATTVTYMLHLEDALSQALATSAYGQTRATVTGPCGVAIGLESAAVTGSDTVKSALVATTDAQGDIEIVITNDGDAGSCALTVSVGSYLTYSRTVKFVGGIDSITISGPSHMVSAASQIAAFNDGLSVECKDEAGIVLGDGGGLSTSYTDGDMNDCDAAGLTVGVTDGDNVALTGYAVASDQGVDAAAALSSGIGVLTFSDSHLYQNVATAGFADTDDTFSVADDGYWDIPADMCATGQQNESRKITFKAGLVSSNTLTVKCVYNSVKITSLTALATGTSGSATSGNNGQTIKVSVAATDGYGNPAGTGSSFTFTTAATGGGASGGTASFSAGSATLTITLGTTSGAQYVIYGATDSDQVTTGAQAFAQKISFTVSNSADALTARTISVGPKGIVVTASGFNAGSVVKFEVENAASGVVRTYSRKANASGVAKWNNATSALKYVTAYPAADTSAITETIEVKR